MAQVKALDSLKKAPPTSGEVYPPLRRGPRTQAPSRGAGAESPAGQTAGKRAHLSLPCPAGSLRVGRGCDGGSDATWGLCWVRSVGEPQ